MKRNTIIHACFLFIFYISHITTSSYAVDSQLKEEVKYSAKDRRLKKFSSPQEYLKENSEKPKILFIGAGLTYDDLVNDADIRFIQGKNIKLTQGRTKYYPPNAYLVDFDGLFFYDKALPSHSDYQADITKKIGEEKSLPKEFIGQFDTIVLENLDLNAMTGLAFKNLWSLLKEKGTIISHIISNTYFEVEVGNPELEPIQEKINDYPSAGILDDFMSKNALAVLYYPHSWVEDDNESFITNQVYTVYPLQDKEDEAYKALAKTGMIGNIISFEKFEELYKNNFAYKRSVFQGVLGVYKYNLEEYFKKLIPDATLSFSDKEDVWTTGVPEGGYFILSRKK